MARPKNPDKTVRCNVLIPLSMLVQIQLMHYNPAKITKVDGAGISETFRTLWAKELRRLRQDRGVIYNPPEEKPVKSTAQILDMRQRVLAGESISQEEYATMLKTLREERGQVARTSNAGGKKSTVVLPSDLNDLFK